MTIFLIPNLLKEKAVEVTKGVISTLHSYGARVLLAEDLRADFGDTRAEYHAETDALEQCDVIVTVGGDGTILHAARKSYRYKKPLLGINLGRVGFLATVEAYELEKLARLVKGDYSLDVRGMLNIHVSGENEFQKTVLNDIVITKSEQIQTVNVAVYCDDILVSHYLGDGVIIATPTGSTAYSLSAGGPVLDARIAGIVVTPICAHSLQSPAMVFSAQRKLRVTINSATHTGGAVICDGSGYEHISEQDNIDIAFSDHCISLVSFNEADQFDAIDNKLKGR